MKSKSLLLNFTLCVATSFLLSVGWFQWHVGWLSLIAFVPMLFLMKNLISCSKKRSGFKFFGYSFFTFLIWNLLTTWWVYFASLAGAISAILVSSLLMAVTMRISFALWKNAGEKIGLLAFICNWISFEYLFINSEIAWPWLELGNAFANNVSLIQWYEFTGNFGGALWILTINVFLFKLIDSFLSNKIIPKTIAIISSILIVVPITYSLVRYYTYKEKQNPQQIVVVQPNVDPYNEKFVISADLQIKNMTELAAGKANFQTDYFVCPETAISGAVQEDYLKGNSSLVFLQNFMRQYPESKFVIGATTLKVYYDGKGKTKTARDIAGSNNSYDIFNSSLQVDSTSKIEIYRKSKLVPGAEQMPYIRIFGFLSDLMVDLGGMTGSHGTQKSPSVFYNEKSGISVGVPVCYESAFAEHISKFVSAGANILFVITNDGWWHDTPGYRQHNSFSKLRAIETRRSIARSANTGISCFINQRGDIVDSLGWCERGSIANTLNANDKITFYVKYGDYLARMSLVVAALLIILQFVKKMKVRFQK